MKITLITVALNPGPLVDRTIHSVAAQRYSNLEWVVVDGGSTDGTVERFRSAPRPPDRMISEPDDGIADAFNKGVDLATGDAVLFLNAGDELFDPDCLARLVERWDRSAHRWIVGAADIFREDGTFLFRRAFERTPPDPFSLVRYNCQIVHQAVLADRRLFIELGPFDRQYRIAMDYSHWIRWLFAGHTPQMVDVPVCRYYHGGASADPLRNAREFRLARRRHGIENSLWVETAVLVLAWCKARIRGRYGLWLYRWKERVGIRA